MAELAPDTGSDSTNIGDGWVEVRATFPDRVIICHYHDRTEDEWEYRYSWDGETVTLGDRAAVKIVETVQRDTDAAAESPAEDAPASETDVEHKSIADLIIDGATTDLLTGRELVENAILRAST
jgi:hypothetical protein